MQSRSHIHTRFFHCFLFVQFVIFLPLFSYSILSLTLELLKQHHVESIAPHHFNVSYLLTHAAMPYSLNLTDSNRRDWLFSLIHSFLPMSLYYIALYSLLVSAYTERKRRERVHTLAAMVCIKYVEVAKSKQQHNLLGRDYRGSGRKELKKTSTEPEKRYHLLFSLVPISSSVCVFVLVSVFLLISFCSQSCYSHRRVKRWRKTWCDNIAFIRFEYMFFCSNVCLCMKLTGVFFLWNSHEKCSDVRYWW